MIGRGSSGTAFWPVRFRKPLSFFLKLLLDPAHRYELSLGGCMMNAPVLCIVG